MAAFKNVTRKRVWCKKSGAVMDFAVQIVMQHFLNRKILLCIHTQTTLPFIDKTFCHTVSRERVRKRERVEGRERERRKIETHIQTLGLFVKIVYIHRSMILSLPRIMTEVSISLEQIRTSYLFDIL